MNNLFGTDGIRALVGTGPLTLTNLTQLGYAIGIWIVEKYGNHARILVARDTRISSTMMYHGLAAGLLVHPIHIDYVDVITTPALCALAQIHTYACAIMITASHNPYHDNGIKIIDGLTGKLGTPDAEHISMLHAHVAPHTIQYKHGGTTAYRPELITSYYDHIKERIHTAAFALKKIVLDCAHGAAFHIAPTLFEQLGSTVIPIHTTPNGYNINHECGALHPQQLQQAVHEHHADIGFAFDGDGDRVIAVTRTGTILDGDDMLAILSQHPDYHAAPIMVGTVMSNSGLAAYLSTLNITFVRSVVGDRAVREKIDEHGALLGGEPSGHIILRDYLHTGDGIFTALRIVEAGQCINWNEQLPYTKFPQKLINIAVQQRFDLTQEPFASCITYFNDRCAPGRLVIRYSGTEPLLRILIEHPDAMALQYHLTEVTHTLQELHEK